MLPPIRVLPGYCLSGCFYHRQSNPWNPQPSAHRHDLNGAAYRLVPGLIHHLRRFDICVAAGPVSDESHFQRHFRRIFRPNPPGLLRMKNDASFNDAKRLYLEQYGDPMVTNTYLKIALALLSVVCVALALIDLRTIRTFQDFRPLVIRIDDLGRAEAINYHNLGSGDRRRSKESRTRRDADSSIPRACGFLPGLLLSRRSP